MWVKTSGVATGVADAVVVVVTDAVVGVAVEVVTDAGSRHEGLAPTDRRVRSH